MPSDNEHTIWAKFISIELRPKNKFARLVVSPNSNGDPPFVATPKYGDQLLVKACRAMSKQANDRDVRILAKLVPHPAKPFILKVADIKAVEP